ncbi:hypothetical protein [Alteromonas sp. ASW11-130]|uniref:hypothetical protein n=1 Tax=Alteromonas sp. ASW11-130 TaxID=3015775 RepID=UPI002241D8FC|nr:hypothetical protein [Alteromonas sp. ASW11-130]MCW8092601.1 hypothetical protein [Alteromonas sp. ASW11-130]
MQRLVFSLLFIFCAGLRAEPFRAEPFAITVGTYQDHQRAIEAATKENNCPFIKDVNLGENQVLSEYLIFCNALKASSQHYQISLFSYPNNSRMLNDVENGRILGTSVGIWRNESREDALAISSPLFRSNEFEKGLYTTKEVLSRVSHLNQLKNSATLLNHNWYHDKRILECSGMKLLHVGFYEQMFNMIKLGRGQFVPITFGPKANLERNQFGIALYPFPGYKMTFPDSTHFVINTKLQSGKQLLNDLNKGLQKLREKGEIETVYQRVGIINKAVANWEPLHCADSPLMF